MLCSWAIWCMLTVDEDCVTYAALVHQCTHSTKSEIQGGTAYVQAWNRHFVNTPGHVHSICHVMHHITYSSRVVQKVNPSGWHAVLTINYLYAFSHKLCQHPYWCQSEPSHALRTAFCSSKGFPSPSMKVPRSASETWGLCSKFCWLIYLVYHHYCIKCPTCPMFFMLLHVQVLQLSPLGFVIDT